MSYYYVLSHALIPTLGEITGTCMRREARSSAGVVATSIPKPGGIDFGVL